jgi:hypothetical protein
MLPH